MTPHEVAARYEHFANRVRSIRPADHRNPFAFSEDVSEVVAELRREARDLRAVPALPTKASPITPGVRTVGRREIRVEMRRRA